MSKIVCIYPVDQSGSKIGGIETYIRDFITYAPLDREITLVGISSGKNTSKSIAHLANKKIEFYPIFSVNGRENKKSKVPLNLRYLLFLFLYKRRIIKSGRYFYFHRIEHVLPFIFSRKRKPIILTVHGSSSEAWKIAGKSWIFRFLYSTVEHIVFNKVNNIILVSNEARKDYSKKYPKIKEKFTVVPTWVDLNIFHPIDQNEIRAKNNFYIQDKIILYVGRLDNTQKDLDLLVDTFAIVKKSISEAKLLIIGDGPYRDELQKKIRSMNLGDVILKGKVDHKNLPIYYNCSDVFLLTSRWEGLPIVVLEALACGVPVVSTEAGDVGKVVKNQLNGFVIKNRNKAALAEKVIELINAKDRLKDNCLKIIKDYTPENSVNKIINFFG